MEMSSVSPSGVTGDCENEESPLRSKVIGTSCDDRNPSQRTADLLARAERRNRRKQARQLRLNEQQQRWAIIVCAVSAVDVVVSTIMLCVAFAHAYRDSGVSLYCVGLQSLAHAMSSAVIAIRFGDEARMPQETSVGPQEGLLRQRRRAHLFREKYVSFAMAAIMITSSVALLLKAVRKLMYWDVWYKDHWDMDRDAKFATIFLTWYGVVVYGGQSFLRGVAVTVLPQPVVGQGFTASLVSLSFLLIIGLASTFQSERTWKAEPIAAMLMSFLTISEGLQILLNHWTDIDARLDMSAFG